MGKKLVKLPATEVDMTAAKYTPQRVQGLPFVIHNLFAISPLFFKTLKAKFQVLD